VLRLEDKVKGSHASFTSTQAKTRRHRSYFLLGPKAVLVLVHNLSTYKLAPRVHDSLSTFNLQPALSETISTPDIMFRAQQNVFDDVVGKLNQWNPSNLY
jgi:hypothetical protein